MLQEQWKRTNGIYVRLLGPVEIWRQGQRIATKASPTAQQLLALLLLKQGQPILRRVVAAQLWPGEEEELARERRGANLRQQLRTLRIVLAEEAPRLIEEGSGGNETLQFDMTEVRVDVLLFEETLRRATATTQQHRLEEALQYYRAPFLSSLANDWSDAERDRLQQKYRGALESFARLSRKDGRIERAIAWLEQGVRIDPQHEEAVSLLMQYYWERGQTAEATKVFQRYQKIFAKISDAKPSAELIELFKQLSDRQRSKGQEVKQKKSATPAPGFHLPAPVQSLLGQEAFCQAIERRLQTTRLLTLTGPGGIGKTRIALEVAHQIRPHFPDGVAFVPLAGVTPPISVTELENTILQALSVASAFPFPSKTTLRRFLLHRQMLLVLDNGEHLLSSLCALVTDLLPQCPGLSILVTSREPLPLEEGMVLPVPSLPVSGETGRDIAQQVQESAAGQLFLRSVPCFPFVVTADTAPMIHEICTLLAGHPLAIKVVAGTMGQFPTPAALLDSIRQSGAPLPDRIVRWSYEQLSPEEQQVLQCLSLFEGGATLEAIRAVVNREDVLTPLRRLEARSLVNDRFPVGQETDISLHRFSLHEIVRQFALMRLWEGDTTARNRYTEYCASLVEAVQPMLQTPEERVALDTLEAERTNMESAIRWGLETQADTASRLCTFRLLAHLYRFWSIRGGVDTGNRHLQAALPYLTDVPDALALKVLRSAGNTALTLGNREEAVWCYQAAQKIATSLGDLNAEAAVLGNLATIHQQRGEFATAKELLLRCRDLFKVLQNEGAVAMALDNLANVTTRMEKSVEAICYHHEAVTLLRQRQDIHGLMLALNNLTYTLLKARQFHTAKETLHEAMLYAVENDNRRAIAHGLRHRIALLMEEKQFVATAELMGASDTFRLRHELPLTDDQEAEYRQEKTRTQVALGAEPFTVCYRRGELLSETVLLSLVLGSDPER